jgi:DNA invertase Pin-like site-specific DNA recombinase
MVTVAEEERRMISNRTKDALAAAKTHGKKPLIERRDLEYPSPASI